MAKFILPENVAGPNEFLNLEGDIKFHIHDIWAVCGFSELPRRFQVNNDGFAMSWPAILPETKDKEFYWEIFKRPRNNYQKLVTSM